MQQVSMVVKLKLLLSVHFVASLINHLSTVSVDSSHSSSTEPFDINQKRAAFQGNKS